MTLVEFLTARLDEDEARLPGMYEGWYDEARYQREVDAKRSIVVYAQACADTEAKFPDDPFWNGEADAMGDAVRYLAAIYSDHPDYDAAVWKP